MKLFVNFVLAWCCLCNWVVNAYKPIAALFNKKQISSRGGGFYKSLSGLLSAGKLTLLNKRGMEELKMIPGSSSDINQERKASTSWWPFANGISNSNKKESSRMSYEVSGGSIAIGEYSPSESTTALSNLIRQSSEFSHSSVAKKAGGLFEYTDIAGFMEYDPKSAAKKAYQTKARNSYRRHVDWFRM